MERRFVKPYVSAISIAAVISMLLVASTAGAPTAEGAKAALFFAALGAFAHALGYVVARAMFGTIGFLPFLTAAALAPDVGALAAVALAVAAGEILRKQPAIRAVFNVAQNVLAIGLAILAFRATGGITLFAMRSVTVQSIIPLVPSFVALFAVFMVVNKIAVNIVVSLSDDRPLLTPLIRSLRSSFAYDLLAMPLVILFAAAYARFGPTWSACLALPMLGVRQLYKSNFELERINEELLQLLVAAIEARDPYTSGHSQRVARYARSIARLAGINGKLAERIYIAALLHDVGKIHEEFAPVLRKAGKLSAEEYETMMTHSAKGAELVARVSRFIDLVPFVRSHHERWDGNGYPDKLTAANIPIGSRVIALADTIDAMTTSRPYREAMTVDEVRRELIAKRGVQFDPKLCDAVLTVAAWSDLAADVDIARREFPVALTEDDVNGVSDSALLASTSAA